MLLSETRVTVTCQYKCHLIIQCNTVPHNTGKALFTLTTRHRIVSSTFDLFNALCKQRLRSVGFDGRCEQGIQLASVASLTGQPYGAFTPVISWTIAITIVWMIAFRLLPSAIQCSSCGKVMFSQVSVCPRGGGVQPWQADTPTGQTPPWQADTPPAGRHPSG